MAHRVKIFSVANNPFAPDLSTPAKLEAALERKINYWLQSNKFRIISVAWMVGYDWFNEPNRGAGPGTALKALVAYDDNK